MKRMLINATQQEELRVALVDGQYLYDLDIETLSREQKKANIYKGRITHIEPSLEAAFVDYGAERHGFLPLKEIAPSYFRQAVPEGGERVKISEVLREGQELIVQIEKGERGTKGAALTTYVALAGRNLVLMPNNPRAGGVSRRIEGDERSETLDALSQLDLPEGMGMIVRTAGGGRTTDELRWDLEYLKRLWESIKSEADNRPAPFLIYQESNLVIRALRDYLRQDISDILIDDPEVHRYARDFIHQVMPNFLEKIKLYEEPVPLFSRFQIESQIETAYQHEIRLPSGGAVVIDHTEALVSIDINSARATRGSDIEETALQTNLEAVDEISRQMRLRDIGGLIVIDFIDMTPSRHQREVENRLKEVLKLDRARVQIGRISRFGLLEMSRQRLRPSLGWSSQISCPRCKGQGTVRSVASLSLSILRVIEEEAMKEKTSRIVAQLPVEVGTYLLNEKRSVIEKFQERYKVNIILIPNPSFLTPNYELQRYRADEDEAAAVSAQPSYQLAAMAEEPVGESLLKERPPAQEPAVKALAPLTPFPGQNAQEAPPAQGAKEGGFIKRLWEGLFSSSRAPAEKPVAEPASQTPPKTDQGGGTRGRSSQQQGRRRRSQSSRRGSQGGSQGSAQESAQGDSQGQGQGQGSRRASSGDGTARRSGGGNRQGQGQGKRSGRGGRRRSGASRSGSNAEGANAASASQGSGATTEDKPQDKSPDRSQDRRGGGRSGEGARNDAERSNADNRAQGGGEPSSGQSHGPSPATDNEGAGGGSDRRRGEGSSRRRERDTAGASASDGERDTRPRGESRPSGSGGRDTAGNDAGPSSQDKSQEPRETSGGGDANHTPKQESS
ncbi:MAG TPA: Rne/Rng family ribonuclease [Gammaproteobacteria bacterium]|nr:Rne/Rng family ribonuclease [Gammaproteobacteria bacterium]